MTLDIQYLVWLQDLRAALGDNLNEVFNGISKFAVVIMPLLPFLIYWAVDKKWGYRFLATIWCGEVINGIVKLSVCAYRPWIRSDAVNPAGDSKVAATGYSFPSGHTMCATATYGTVFVWQRKKTRWLAVLCAVMILLTMFSRNFLGVHTPQDVIVGFLETALIIFLMGKLFAWMDGNDTRINIMLATGLLLIAATLVYIQVKSYPMDYVDGKLLVDPQAMMNDTFKGCGCLLGLIIGCFIERRWIHYEIPQGHPALPVLAAAGLGIIFAWDQYFAGATIIPLLGAHWGRFVAYALELIFAVAAYPAFIKRIVRPKETTETVAA